MNLTPKAMISMGKKDLVMRIMDMIVGGLIMREYIGVGIYTMIEVSILMGTTWRATIMKGLPLE